MCEISKYRSFVIVIHITHGCLLLESSKNKFRRGENYQLPGGRLNIADTKGNKNFENIEELKIKGRSTKIEDAVFKAGAARELYEETGLDFRNKLERFESLDSFCSYKFRFFLLKISNEDDLLFGFDSMKNDNDNQILSSLINSIYKIYYKLCNYVLIKSGILTKCSTDEIFFYLKLSKEHKSFVFENNHEKIPVMIRNHSKGVCSRVVEEYFTTENCCKCDQ